MAKARRLRLGTRASRLARWQADWTADRLAELGIEVELVPITTEGDVERTGPISTLSSQGVFTKRIQEALLAETIDLAVHSLKDLPTAPVEGLLVAAVPRREAVTDVLVSRQALSLTELPHGATVGTGSLRRRAQLLYVREDLTLQNIRGNVDSRLRKLDEGAYDAVVLAEAGLKRLGLDGRITQVLPTEIMLPAIGQGALGIEVRADDTSTRQVLAPLDHRPTHEAVTAERAMLSALHGGCLAPIGAWARVHGDRLTLEAVVLSDDGKQKLKETASAEAGETAVDLGRRVAEALLRAGAAPLIEAARNAG